jgi:hypothetical protein
MPIVTAGDTCNFITGYTADGNAQADYGKNVWLAQSFPLSAIYRILRCPFKLWDTQCGNIKYFALRHALADGTPTGANIAETHLSVQSSNTSSPGKWLMIDFMSFPNLTAGQYALLAYVPDAHFTNGQHISAQAVPRLYTQGKAFKSTDSGATWAEIPNTNLLFQIWGWQEPPAPPPLDAIGNWYQDIPVYPPPAPNFTIVTTTNIKVHQFLRWSITPPQRHVRPVIVRGAVAGTFIDQCFVVYYDVEQNEPGDTLIHTFTFTDWPVCQTRYYYLWATKLAQLMPSASPIYTKHRLAPPGPITIKIYSDFDHGLTTCDGAAERSTLRDTWPQIHDGFANNAWTINQYANIYIRTTSLGLRFTNMQRQIMTFSLASIPLGATILSAQYVTWGIAKQDDNDNQPRIAVFQSYPVSNNDVVIADYQRTSATPLSNIINYANFNVGGWNTFTLTPAGIALLIPGQITRLAVREAKYDAPNTSPPSRSGPIMLFRISHVEYSDATKRPYLEVTYLAP